MKRILFFSILFTLIGLSCSKEGIISPSKQDTVKSNTPLIDERFKTLKRFKYNPTIFNLSDFADKTKQEAINNKKQNTVSFIRDSTWANGRGKTSFYESTEIPAILPETRLKLFLGAIIKGDKAIDVDNFTPLQIAAQYRNPITLYANFPTDLYFRTVNFPSPGQDAAYIRAALMAGSYNQIQSFTYEQTQFRRVDELKKSFGANFNIGKILTVDFLDTSANYTNKTRVKAEFTQENFSINIEPPIYEPFLKSNIDMSQFGGYDPLIVSSVTYGRKGIFMLESDSSYNMVRTTLNIALNLTSELTGINIPGTDPSSLTISLKARLTKEQIGMLNTAKIYVYVIGVDGVSTVKAITGGLVGFCEVLAKSGNFSPSSPGVPLYYTLNYLSDFGTFRNKFKINIAN